MSMTKADFEAVAAAVAETKHRVVAYAYPPNSPNRVAALYALDEVTRELATACARQYKGGAGFNRQRFVDACGFPDA